MIKLDTIVFGDIHADWSFFNKFINRKKPKVILACGDFGYWPRLNDKVPKAGDTKVYFADGNHEDHDSLDLLTDNQVYPNVFYMKRGSTLTLDDGRKILFIGGATSYDKIYRTQGVDWFPQEVISHKDINNLPDTKIDIVISHTLPTDFDMVPFQGKDDDPCRKVLSYVLDKYRPSLWYGGHWHMYKTGFVKDCRWTCLDRTPLSNCWKKLD